MLEIDATADSRAERYTGGGWEHVSHPYDRLRPIIDAHVHVFPPLGTTNANKQRSAWRFHLRDSTNLRHRECGERVLEPLLAISHGHADATEEIAFRFTDFGQAESTIDGEYYVAQIYPPSTIGQETGPDRMVAERDQVWVDVGVLKSDHVYGDVVPYYYEAMKRHPGRFIALAQVWEPDAGDVGELERVHHSVESLGSSGVYLSVETVTRVGSPLGLDDEYFDELWELIAEMGVPVFWYLDDRSNQRGERLPGRLTELARWSDHYLTSFLVITHGVVPAAIIRDLGMPPNAIELLKRPNLFGEICIPPKWPGFPYPEGQEHMRMLRGQLGADKLLSGTDSPYSLTYCCTYRQALDVIRRHCDFLTLDEKRDILSRNAARIFGIQNLEPPT